MKAFFFSSNNAFRKVQIGNTIFEIREFFLLNRKGGVL